jgi:hypothetical protein
MSWPKGATNSTWFSCRTDATGDFLIINKEFLDYTSSGIRSITFETLERHWSMIAESDKEAVFKRKPDKHSFEYQTAQLSSETTLPT